MSDTVSHVFNIIMMFFCLFDLFFNVFSFLFFSFYHCRFSEWKHLHVFCEKTNFMCELKHFHGLRLVFIYRIITVTFSAVKQIL